MNEDLTILLGKHINKTFWTGTGKLIVLTDDMVYTFEGEGDCCNEVWIEDLDNNEALQDAEVLEVHDTESDGPFFATIKTTKGLCTISVRNDQNNEYYAYSGRIVLTETRNRKGEEVND